MTGKHIADLLEEHLNELEDYGLLQEDLDGLNAKIAAYEEVMAEPRNAIIHRATITKAISRQMHELDTMLKRQLDNFVKSLMTTQPNFVNLYLQARDVIRYKGGSSKSPEDVVGDEPNLEDDGE